MVIAALVSFGILLIAWITAPGDQIRRDTPSSATDLELPTADGLARAACRHAPIPGVTPGERIDQRTHPLTPKSRFWRVRLVVRLHRHNPANNGVVLVGRYAHVA